MFNFFMPKFREFEVAKELFEKNENLRLPLLIYMYMGIWDGGVKELK